MLYVYTNYDKCFNILKNNHFNLITITIIQQFNTIKQIYVTTISNINSIYYIYKICNIKHNWKKFFQKK